MTLPYRAEAFSATVPWPHAIGTTSCAISRDGGAFVPVASISAGPAAGWVTISLDATEMDSDRIAGTLSSAGSTQTFFIVTLSRVPSADEASAVQSLADSRMTSSEFTSLPSTEDITESVWGYTGRSITDVGGLATAVWSYVTRGLTDLTGFTLSAAYAALTSVVSEATLRRILSHVSLITKAPAKSKPSLERSLRTYFQEELDNHGMDAVHIRTQRHKPCPTCVGKEGDQDCVICLGTGFRVEIGPIRIRTRRSSSAQFGGLDETPVGITNDNQAVIYCKHTERVQERDYIATVAWKRLGLTKVPVAIHWVYQISARGVEPQYGEGGELAYYRLLTRDIDVGTRRIRQAILR